MEASMDFKRAILCSLGVLSLLVAGGAYAQRLYLGATGGVSSWNVDCAGTSTCDTSSSTFRGFLGYNFVDVSGRVQVGVEAFYMDLGHISASIPGSATSVTIEAEGYGLALATSGRFTPNSRFGYFARVGVANVESEANPRLLVAGRIVNTKSSARAVIGLGANFFVTPNFSVRVETNITSVKWPDEQTSGVIGLLGGVALHF
jgi:OmpA-OmpF porin, OOP family